MVKRILLYSSANELADSNGKENINKFLESKSNNKRIIKGWAFYDWANSAFALVISVAVFPAYFINTTPDTIPILGMEISNSALFSYTISFAYLLIMTALPYLSGLADYSGMRKSFLKAFTWLGSLACISLFFFKGESTLLIGLFAFMIAQIGFDGGKVFYNSYLPIISTPDQYDKVSARGFAYGYIGSVLLLIINLLMIQFPAFFGLPEGELPARISFVMVGLWWIGFAQIPFSRLPPDRRRSTKDFITEGKKIIITALRDLWPRKHITRFLISFFFYSAGVQTILYLAATFAEKELDFETANLILLILILQVVAIGGAYLFAWVSRVKNNKTALIIMLIIWMSICILAYFVEESTQFYGVAVLVGLVMGGIQATSRAAYSKLLPVQDKAASQGVSEDPEKNQLNSYYSFYEVLEKAAIVFGTFSFGLIDQLSGNMRNSVLVLGVYFIIGLALLINVQFDGQNKGTPLSAR